MFDLDIWVMTVTSGLQLAQRESQLKVAEQQRVRFEQEISALHAELSQQHAEVQSLQDQLEVANEREMVSSVAADLDHLLDDPDQLPAEAHQLMSSLRREPAQSDEDLPAKLQQLQKQLQRKEEEMRERNSAMQQLLRGADRIEEVQRDTLRQLADAQSEVMQWATFCIPGTFLLTQCNQKHPFLHYTSAKLQETVAGPVKYTHGVLLQPTADKCISASIETSARQATNFQMVFAAVCVHGGSAHIFHSGDQPAQGSGLNAGV